MHYFRVRAYSHWELTGVGQVLFDNRWDRLYKLSGFVSGTGGMIIGNLDFQAGVPQYLQLSSANTCPGLATINNVGFVKLAAGGKRINSGINLVVNAGGTLEMNGNQTWDSLTGSGSLTKADPGATTPTAANYYIAATVVNGGTQGGLSVTSAIARKIVQAFQEPAKSPETNTELTVREGEILELLAKGSSNQEIGSKLEISHFTVKIHLAHIFEKLHVRSRTEAVMAYLQKRNDPPI